MPKTKEGNDPRMTGCSTSAPAHMDQLALVAASVLQEDYNDANVRKEALLGNLN
jgi:hypothetical protein